ncbi:hypothetical protein B0H11DRAFT_2244172 [Mycena galericulata]|nr:hypothetical protein B0H11DRAFT_2244172 [Mycena galericulata]
MSGTGEPRTLKLYNTRRNKAAVENLAVTSTVVIHAQSVLEASSAQDKLMRQKQEHTWWQLALTDGIRLINALVSFPLSAFLVAIQLLSVRNELYSNVFESTSLEIYTNRWLLG